MAGHVTAFRVFAVNGESGAHTAHIYNASTGAVLAGPQILTYDGNDSWMEFPLDTPLAVEANKEYLVAVSTGEDGSSNYGAKAFAFSSAIDVGGVVTIPADAGKFGDSVDAMPSGSWNQTSYFRDVVFAPASLGHETLIGDKVPAPGADYTLYSMGTAFKPIVSGKVKAYRIFAVAGDNGDHTAYIYDKSTGEAIAGPQTLNYEGNNSWLTFPLNKPLAVEADKEYIVAISTSKEQGAAGHYGATGFAFENETNNGSSIIIPANAGMFGMGADTIPTDSFNSANYYRDIVFAPDEITPAVISLNEAGADVGAVKTILESAELNMNLVAYQMLLPKDHEEIVATVIAQKPSSGYVKKSQVQKIIDRLSSVAFEINLLANLNAGSSIDDVKKALVSPDLGMNLWSYSLLSRAEKDTAAQAIIDEKPEDGYRKLAELQAMINKTVGAQLSLPSDADSPQVHEEFLPWTGAVSSDGLWRKAGPWKGTADNDLAVERAITQDSYNGQDGGFLILKSNAGVKEGAEVQSLHSYGYGYYEIRMKPTDVPGVTNSFFWSQSTNGYGPHEWDIEFFTNRENQVEFTIHPLEDGQRQALTPEFDYSADFHNYGFLWTPGRIDFSIDGKIVQTFENDILITGAKGYIMMNSWTEETWLEGPPAQDAEVVYDWVKYYPLREVDKNKLEEAFAAADALNSADFTTASWQAVQTALSTAAEVDNSLFSTQEQINDSAISLMNKIDGLVKGSSEVASSVTTPVSTDVEEESGSNVVLYISLFISIIIVAALAWFLIRKRSGAKNQNL